MDVRRIGRQHVSDVDGELFLSDLLGFRFAGGNASLYHLIEYLSRILILRAFAFRDDLSRL